MVGAYHIDGDEESVRDTGRTPLGEGRRKPGWSPQEAPPMDGEYGVTEVVRCGMDAFWAKEEGPWTTTQLCGSMSDMEPVLHAGSASDQSSH